MFKVVLHPEVIKFLDSTATKWVDSDGEESYVVNNSWYKATDEPGVYTVQFIEQKRI